MNKNKNLNSLRILAVESINKANSGHPGIALGAAPMVHTLFSKIMYVNPDEPKWINRDRFVLSAGHGSSLLYSMLHLSGFNLSLEQVKNFRQLDSLTPGHPEFNHTDGVDITTGPLGQGFAMAVGMALAETKLANSFNKEGHTIIDHFTYVLCGDGDFQEGVCQEAISFAGRYRLNKLIVLHDSNDIQLDAPVSVAQSENMKARFEAANWNTIKIEDGESLEAIEQAIEQAKKSPKPTYIEVKTIIGIGSTNEGTQKVHGAPLGEDLKTIKNKLDWKNKEFEIDKEVYDFYKDNVKVRGQNKYSQWLKVLDSYKTKFPKEFSAFNDAVNSKHNFNISELKKLISKTAQASRVSSGNVLNELSKEIPFLIGGSADLTESTKAKGADGNYDFDNLSGRNIMYGVREFAMAAINNGISAHGGLLPFSSGFFVFSDYMKSAIRMSSLMGVQQLYIFTHDSIAVGEDGPTHQPIEQLAMLRSIPNISVFRPADSTETLYSYLAAVEEKNKPTVIVLTRQNLDELNHNENSIREEVKKGAYIISDEKDATVSLISSGSEVKLAMDIKEILSKSNIKAKVVSMVNMNLFNEQPEEYKNKIIDRSTQRFSLELGSTFGWHKYLGDTGHAFGIDRFGKSAPFDKIIENFKFNKNNISDEILKLIKS